MGVLRVSLVLYLSLVTLAGPWYCCCTLASMIQSARSAKPEEDTPEEPASPCCCCPKPAEAPRGQAEKTPDQPETPPVPLCPCHERQRNTYALTTLPSGLSAEPRTAAALDALDPAAFSCIVDPFLRPALPHGWERLVLPALSGRDILCACHILRC